MTRARFAVIAATIAGAVVVVVARGGAHADPETPDQRVLRLLDQYRQIAGMPPVVVDPTLSKGCMEHAEYMRLNANSDAMVGLNAHKQRPELPGATAAGAACGRAADLFPGVSDLGLAVDGWMAGIYHRRPMLSPQLLKIGVGYAANGDGTMMAALMFVDADAPVTTGWPVAYPANAQTEIPIEYGNEVPDPVPTGFRGGYPITLEFPPFDPVVGVHATLTDAAGKDVPIFLSDPEHPATSFGQYGMVSVIAQTPLLPESTYKVKIDATWKGKAGTWAWSFTTVKLHHANADDEAQMMAVLGMRTIVHATVSYAAMMDSSTVFLQVGQSTSGKYEMASVLIPTSRCGSSSPARRRLARSPSARRSRSRPRRASTIAST